MKEHDFLTTLHEQIVQKNHSYSALNLAYLGDAVFELCVRTKVISTGNIPVNQLHKAARNYVKASAQAEMYYKIIEHLHDDEISVLKRGRNAKSHTAAKNASITEYRHATGLEALFGYLFLNNKMERIIELFTICVNENKIENRGL